MTVAEGTEVTQNVKNNNNIAWKNTSVVDILPDLSTDVSGVIAVGNYTNATKSYTLELHPEKNEYGKALYLEAEISLEMDTILYDAWTAGNSLSTNLNNAKNPKLKIVNDSIALLENL
jgi:hypothetical protein